MKTVRSLRSTCSRFNHRHSNSPTLSSSYSEKGFWSKSYKNQPFPKELKRRLIGHKFKFSDFSDEEEDTSGVVVEEEEIQILEKKKILPHVTIMSDRGEFLDSRSRIKSQRKINRGSQRCRSVQSLKLPQVMEEKKEEDELQKLERSKLSEVKDRNEFNQRSSRHQQNTSLTDNSKDSREPSHFSSLMPEQIVQNEAEQTKSEKLKQDKSIIQNEYDKLIVDQVDDKKWKKEESQRNIEEIIQEDFLQHETDNVNNLRISLGKFEQEAQYLNKASEQFRVSSHNSEHSDEGQKQKKEEKNKEKEYQTMISQ